MTRSTIRPKPGQSSADLQYETARLYSLLRVRHCAAIYEKKYRIEFVAFVSHRAVDLLGKSSVEPVPYHTRST